MKVAIVTDWECDSGIYTYSVYLTEQLSKKIEIKIIPIKNPHAFDPIYFSLRNFYPRHIIWFLRTFRAIMSAKKYFDVINFQEPIWVFAPLLYFSLFFRKGRAKIVTTIHEIYVEDEKKSILLRFHRNIMLRLIAKCSDKIIVHTEYARKLLEKKGLASEKVVIIPHGCYQHPRFLDKELCKSKLSLEGKKVTTIFGFINPIKGYKKILNILPLLNDEIVLLVAGGLPNPYSREQWECFQLLKQKEKETGGKVKVTGYVKDEDLPVILNATDIMLFPYDRVLQSGVLNIALAYRIPTITSDLPYFRDVKKKYECIEIAKDELNFVEKIKTLLTDKAIRNKLITNCQKYWNENNWEKVADKYIEVFRSVIT
jgi:hypothetical protein